MNLHETVARIGRLSALDAIAKPLGDAVTSAIGRGPVKDALSGTWLGHPVHPLATDIPIGAFTSATVLDLFGGRRSRRASSLLIALGIAASVPTAASGLSDWSDTQGAERRVGLVHAASNTVALSLFGLSLWSRLRGRHWRGKAYALAGAGAMSVGGYLGGHLTYADGVGVNATYWQHGPSSEWTTILERGVLAGDVTATAHVDDVDVLVREHEGRVMAMNSRCTHAGGPLDEGDFREVDGRLCVTCPWHGSQFHVDDGSVVHGPATLPQPVYETRVVGDKVEIRST